MSAIQERERTDAMGDPLAAITDPVLLQRLQVFDSAYQGLPFKYTRTLQSDPQGQLRNALGVTKKAYENFFGALRSAGLIRSENSGLGGAFMINRQNALIIPSLYDTVMRTPTFADEMEADANNTVSSLVHSALARLGPGEVAACLQSNFERNSSDIGSGGKSDSQKASFQHLRYWEERFLPDSVSSYDFGEGSRELSAHTNGVSGQIILEKQSGQPELPRENGVSSGHATTQTEIQNSLLRNDRDEAIVAETDGISNTSPNFDPSAQSGERDEVLQQFSQISEVSLRNSALRVHEFVEEFASWPVSVTEILPTEERWTEFAGALSPEITSLDIKKFLRSVLQAGVIHLERCVVDEDKKISFTKGDVYAFVPLINLMTEMLVKPVSSFGDLSAHDQQYVVETARIIWAGLPGIERIHDTVGSQSLPIQERSAKQETSTSEAYRNGGGEVSIVDRRALSSEAKKRNPQKNTDPGEAGRRAVAERERERAKFDRAATYNDGKSIGSVRENKYLRALQGKRAAGFSGDPQDGSVPSDHDSLVSDAQLSSKQKNLIDVMRKKHEARVMGDPHIPIELFPLMKRMRSKEISDVLINLQQKFSVSPDVLVDFNKDIDYASFIGMQFGAVVILHLQGKLDESPEQFPLVRNEVKVSTVLPLLQLTLHWLRSQESELGLRKDSLSVASLYNATRIVSQQEKEL